ncbi:MAG: hypothetical protein Q8P12_07570, partial [bacterium]|nr:hypothetical protein [bacterium]
MISGSLRSRAYLQMLAHHNLVPPEIILLQPRHKGPPLYSLSPADRVALETLLEMSIAFDPEEDEAVTCQRLGLKPRLLVTDDFNHPETRRAVLALPGDTLLISPAGILRQNLLDCGKRFLHLHPGRLPQYRGSTTFYYSLLEEKSLSCSAFLLSEALDSGPVLHVKHLSQVTTRLDIDSLLDPLLRAATLVELLKQNP